MTRLLFSQCVVWMALALSPAVLAQSIGRDDGKLVASAAVALPQEKIRRMQAVRADIRSVLARVEVRSLTYLSDGLRVRGYLAMPRQGRNLPCVIYNRGGNRDFGALDDDTAVATLARIASWGYVVVASQYRGNAGGEGHEEFGGADVNDVLNLVPLLQSLPRADPRRIGMIGFSRGGMMTYLALGRTDQVAAAIVVSGMSDAFDSVARRPEMEDRVYSILVPDFHENRHAALVHRSPVRWAERLSRHTPMLLVHGSADERVHASQALGMASALLASRHPFRLVIFEGGGHDLSAHQGEVEQLVRGWLDRHVRGRTGVR